MAMGNCAGATSAQLQGVTPGPPTARQKPKRVSSFGLRDAHAPSAAPKLATASATDALAVPAALGAEIVAPLELTFALLTDGRRASALASAAHLPPDVAASPTLPDKLRLPRDDDIAARAVVRVFAEETERTHGLPKRVEGAEHRATTLRELRVLVEHVQQHSSTWVRTRRNKDGSVILGADGEPIVLARGLEAEDVNLYDVNLNLLAPLGSELGVAYSELFACGKERTPKTFLSHAWSHPLLRTVEALEQHAKDREYGEDEPIWICAFAIRQHQVEIPASINASPFFKALKAAAMTLIVISAVDMGVLSRVWCGLEAFLAMVEGGAGYLTDIYTHHDGGVRQLTDGLIAADMESDDPPDSKARRDDLFPLSVVLKALSFELCKTAASVQADKDNIITHVSTMEKGEAVVNATVRARYFVAALPAILESDDGPALFEAGAEALQMSTLPRLTLTSAIGEGRALTLVRSLPSTLVELLLPGVGIGDAGAIGLGEFVKVNALLTTLDLGNNKIAAAGAIGLGKALEDKTSLTTLRLGDNQIADAGAVALGKALAVNASLTVLGLEGNWIADSGAIGLGKALEVNASLTVLSLRENKLSDAAALALAGALKVNASLSVLDLGDNKIADAGAIGFSKALEVNASLTKANVEHHGVRCDGCSIDPIRGLRFLSKLVHNFDLCEACFLVENSNAEDQMAHKESYTRVNASLTELHLYSNKIGEAGAIGLGKALAVNASLTTLSLWGNQIGDKGAIGLAEGLKVNASLTELYLSDNQIADGGAIGLGKALKVKASLTLLSLSDNQIANKGAIGLAEGLKVNASLTNVNLLRNNFGVEAAEALMKAAALKGGQVKSLCGIEAGASSASFLDVADAGAILISYDLTVNSSLTELSLSDNQIADAGAIALGKALAVNASLITLILGDNQIGDAGKSAVRAAWKGISWNDTKGLNI